MMSVPDRGRRASGRHHRALIRAAAGAAAAGLPVVPGAWWNPAARRFDCDQPGCTRTGPHPAVAAGGVFGIGAASLTSGLTMASVRDPDAVRLRWRCAPYAVLIPTGETCDVVDVPEHLGRALAMRLDARSALGPLIAAGSRWFFLTASGGGMPALGGDVLVHGQGSWVMLPPSQGPGGEAASWLARPARGSWRLPRRDDVMRALEMRVLDPRVPDPRRPADLRPAV